MSLRVSIEDTGLELAVCVAVSGGYNPDVLHDLQARAGETYRAALVDKPNSRQDRPFANLIRT